MPARFTTASNVPATASRSSRNANRRTFSASSYGSFSGPATSTTLGGGRKTRRAAQPRQVRSTGQQYAAQPCGADPLAAVVADDDLVRDDRAAQPQRRRDAGHGAVAGRPVVGGVDVHADRPPAGGPVRVHGGTDRAERLRQYARGAAVQQPVRLGVSVDRHRSDDALGRGLDDRDAQPLGQRSGSPAEDLLHAGDPTATVYTGSYRTR